MRKRKIPAFDRSLSLATSQRMRDFYRDQGMSTMLEQCPYKKGSLAEKWWNEGKKIVDTEELF
jgi:hypothetical protein